MIVLIQLFEENGFMDEFESKVIENIVKRSSYVKWASEDTDSQYYLLKKKDIEDLLEVFKEEKIRQREKSLFKKRQTRTLTELRIIVDILEILKNDQVVQDEENIVRFVLKEDELLDI